MESATFPNNTVLDLSSSFGQVLVSSFVATMFWGMVCLQALFYFMNYESDRWYFKALVTVLWVLHTIHEFFCIQGSWNYLIPMFGDLVTISMTPPQLMYQVAVTGVVSATAQIFYTWRIWRIANKNWIFPVVLVPPTIGQMIGCFVYAAKGIGKPETFLGTPEMSRLGLSLCSTISFVDVLIAIILCVLLRRGRTGVVASDRVLLRLINASVSTGTFTAVFALISIIALGVWPAKLYYTIGEIPLCALYCNAVLANLNSRRFIRGTGAKVSIFLKARVAESNEIELSQLSSDFGAGTTKVDMRYSSIYFELVLD